MAKKKRRQRRLNDLVKFQVKALARFGFSHRYIASMVFHKPADKVTNGELTCIASYCYRNEIRVSDWRNGRTAESRQYSTRCMKPPKNRRFKVRRAA